MASPSRAVKRLLSMLLPSAFACLACAAEPVPRFLDRAPAIERELALEACECAPDPEHCRSMTNHRADGAVASIESECAAETYPASAALHDYLDCVLEAREAGLACMREVGCDEDALVACDDFAATRFDACPVSSERDYRDWRADVRVCARDAVVGRPSGCPGCDAG